MDLSISLSLYLNLHPYLHRCSYLCIYPYLHRLHLCPCLQPHPHLHLHVCIHLQLHLSAKRPLLHLVSMVLAMDLHTISMM